MIRRPKQLPCAGVDDERPIRQRDSGCEGCRSSRLYEVDSVMMTKTGEEVMRRDCAAGGSRPEVENMDVDSTRSTEAVYQEIADVRSDVVTIDVVVHRTRTEDRVPSACSSSKSASKRSERRLCRHPVGGCDDSGFAKHSPLARRSVDDDEDRVTSDEENQPPSSISGNVLDLAFVIASGSSSSSRGLRRRERKRRSRRQCKLSKTTLWDPSISVIRPVNDDDASSHNDAVCSLPSSGQRHVTSPPARVGHSAIKSALTEFRKLAPSVAAASAVTRHRKHCPTSSEIVRQIALCERRFADDLSEVVSRLSRPLRYQGNGVENDVIVSREQHELLFQNIEKVGIARVYRPDVSETSNISPRAWYGDSYQRFDC